MNKEEDTYINFAKKKSICYNCYSEQKTLSFLVYVIAGRQSVNHN